ncbi:MAG: hypothetical protein K2H00_01875, partial [Muribaculum intestinale]|nr:hypothetical protein [Muribaculum intestinale]
TVNGANVFILLWYYIVKMISMQKYVKLYFRKILFRFKTVQTPNFYRIRKFRLCGYTLNNTCVPTGNPELVTETAPSLLFNDKHHPK